MASDVFIRHKILQLMDESGRNFTPICCTPKHFDQTQEELRIMRDEGLIFGFRCFDGLGDDKILTIAQKDVGFKNKDERLLFMTNDWEAERELPLWDL